MAMEDFFEVLKRIREEMRRIVEDVEKEFMEIFPLESREGIVEPLTYSYETPSEIIITLNLPLVKRKEDISVRVEDGNLIVEAELCERYSFGLENPFFKACTAKKYRKVFNLPEDVDISEIRAKFKSGVLEIRIPKKHRGIRIKVE